MNHCLLFNTYRHARTSGMHRIATHLRQQNWNVECIEFASLWSLDELKLLSQSRITKNTKFIGFSFLFDEAWELHLTEFCSWIKSTYPDIVIISGSQGAGIRDQSIPIDYHVGGYGEYGLDALLSYKFSNGPRPKFNLTLDRKKLIETLHHYPAYPLRDPMIIYENRDFLDPEEWLGVEFSRGCKFHCDYCNFPILGVKGDYTRTVESFKTQITDAHDRFGIRNYYVSDETFNDRTEKITKFADVVESLSWKPYFTGYIRADLMVKRLQDREELLRMNFLGHYYGVESFNHKSAKAVSKGMNSAELQQGLVDCKTYFQKNSNNLYRGSIGLIVGLPHETLESLDRTLTWLNHNWHDQSIKPFPLQIIDDELARPSKMSLDYKKYGYEAINSFRPVANQLAEKVVNWKSKWMDLQTATAYGKFLNSTVMGSRLDAFGISRIYENPNGQLATLQEKLDGTYSKSISLDNKNLTNGLFVKNYIAKKLNWDKE
jgi:hypothetical protein